MEVKLEGSKELSNDCIDVGSAIDATGRRRSLLRPISQFGMEVKMRKPVNP